jgi:hypothetical protein
MESEIELSWIGRAAGAMAVSCLDAWFQVFLLVQFCSLSCVRFVHRIVKEFTLYFVTVVLEMTTGTIARLGNYCVARLASFWASRHRLLRWLSSEQDAQEPLEPEKMQTVVDRYLAGREFQLGL